MHVALSINILLQFGCCANSEFLGTGAFATACGINSEQCAPFTGGTSALHSIVGILTSMIFAGLAMMFNDY